MFFSWSEFVRAVARTPIQYPQLKVVYLAQCILESGRGTSFLFEKAGNPTGLKWRSEMHGFAEQKFLKTPTEPQGVDWCLWRTPEDAVRGYWRFITRPPYQGWEQHGDNPLGYLQHLKKAGYATDDEYVDKVSALFSEAQSLINDVGVDMANWFLIDRADDGSPLVSAMANATASEMMKSASKPELISFLQRFEDAQTFLVAPGSGELTEEEATALDKAMPQDSATWYQFFREITGKPAVVAMNNGTPVNILRSSNKADLIDFLKHYPGANTFQIASPIARIVISAGSIDATLKPQIRWVTGCPNFSSRNGATITSIVVHYTTSRNINGTISWFKNPDSRVSAHYIIGRDGEIVQMVRDADKAWHCLSFNANSIGIEHVAEPEDRLTPEQERASAALIRWLMAEYKIPAKNVYGHQWNPNTPNRTSCPGSLWQSQSNLQEWIQSKVLSA